MNLRAAKSGLTTLRHGSAPFDLGTWVAEGVGSV